MPHVIVKLYAGRTAQQKAKLAEEITKVVMTAANVDEDAVSVAVEDIKPQDWTEKVYKPDILGNRKNIYKEPGYNPL